MDEIRTLYWQDNGVVMIDQKALPLIERTVTCWHYEDVITAINDMTIRGAPAIGVAAAMGIALGALHIPSDSPEDFRSGFYGICDRFARTRPTARNLFWAIERMKGCLADLTTGQDTPIEVIREALVAEAVKIGEEDVAINRRMGLNGRSLIRDGDRILTHCNAGALATAGYGTAIGVIRAACKEGKRVHVFVDETRPVLQGARLTAWELMKEGIPATLITDGMAGFLMRQGKVDLVITGADRIAANGDTANKIGTYMIALAAERYGIPFYVAAPVSTFDAQIPNGAYVQIEERSGDEVKRIAGRQITLKDIAARYYSFDVTAARYVTAFITERGIVERPFRKYIKMLFR